MKLLLKRNVSNVGSLGDIVEVASGYARNYLIPQGLGIEVTKGNLQWFEAQKRKLIAQEEETKEKLRLIAEELAGKSCTIIARATEEGHLFGSVTPRDIATQFAEDGVEIDPKTVILERPIKEIGIYRVPIQLHAEVHCEVKVWVVKGDESRLLEEVEAEMEAAERQHQEASTPTAEASDEATDGEAAAGDESTAAATEGDESKD